MSGDVVLTSALRSNLLSLQNTQRLIDTTQLRLATGLKVNSALDNPQNFFASQSLNNRAGDLTRLLDGISQSIRTIEEADQGITALTSLVEQSESVALEALSEIRAAQGFANFRGTESLVDIDDLVADSGGNITAGATDQLVLRFTDEDGTTTSTADITVAGTVYDLVADINTALTGANLDEDLRASLDTNGRLKIESLTEGGLITIEEGTNGLTAAGFNFLGLDNIAGSQNEGTPPAALQGGTAVSGRVIRSDVSAGTQVNDKYEASDDLVTAGYLAAAGDDLNISISIDGVSTDVGQVTGADTVQDVLDRINNANLKVEAAFNADTGRIELTFDDDVGQAEVAFVANGASNTTFGFGAGVADGALAAGGDTQSELFTFVGTSSDLAQFQKDYNKLRDQIDGIVEDANYRGVNLLGGDNLTTFFNEDRDNTLVTEGVDFTALGLGLTEADFTDTTGVQQAIDEARAALADVRNFGSSIANDLAIIQTRRDFTEGTINTLKAGADDLVVADQNEEGANLLALQTRQQLGVTSLSLAAQSQQSVLRLF